MAFGVRSANPAPIITVNEPPVWSTVPLIQIERGSSAYVASYCIDEQVLTFSYQAGTVDPSWVGADGSINVPSNAALGDYTLVVKADDGVGSGNVGITSHTVTVPLHDRPKPAYKGTDYDPDFQTTITRITDPPEENFTDALPNYLVRRRYNFYSEIQAFDASETLIMLSDANGKPEIIDATTYEVRVNALYGVIPGPSICYKWSPTEARTLYCWNSDLQSYTAKWPVGRTPHSGAVLCKITIHPTTYALDWTIIKDWPQFRGMYKDPSWENIQADVNGNLWTGVCAGRLADNWPICFAHNITTGADSAYLDFWAAAPARQGFIPGNVWMSPKADRIIFSSNSTDPAGGGTPFRGTEVYDFNWNRIKQIQNQTGHCGFAIDSNGVQWMVFFSSAWTEVAPAIYKSRIDGPDVEKIIMKRWQWGNLDPLGQYGVHISGCHHGPNAATPDKNFVVVSMDSPENPETGAGAITWHGPFCQEIYLMYMDQNFSPGTPNEHVLRLCQNHGKYNYYFGSNPFATINPSGTRILFNTSWDYKDPVSNKITRADTFLMELP